MLNAKNYINALHNDLTELMTERGDLDSPVEPEYDKLGHIIPHKHRQSNAVLGAGRQQLTASGLPVAVGVPTN